jgi:coenzyme F420-0:L-glutamate ligase/coenzyme F420-1:gamma-L-glutamate ligase
VETTVAEPGRAADLVRPPDEDLFRTSPLDALLTRSQARSFAPGDVPRDALEEAVRAACVAPGPDPDRRWLFVAVESETGRRRLLDAATGADPGADAATLSAASVMIVPWLRFADLRGDEDDQQAHALQERSLLAAGAAIQALMLALHARGLATAWSGSTLFRQRETRAALDVDEGWFALGAIAVGRAPLDAPPEDAPVDIHPFLEMR